MTKPRNSAGRKNERRISARARLNPEAPSETGKRSRQEAEAEYQVLSERIVPQAQADAVRTKKTKADGWSEARSAWNRGKVSR